MNNTLKLRKCAYIFDQSYNNYFCGTREQHAEKIRTQNAIKEYYNSEEKRAEEIPYTLDSQGNPVIIVNDKPHRLNALQIASINGDPENVINHRRHINVDEIKENTPHFHIFCSRDLYSNKFKSLHFEFFTGDDELGYIRVNFKGCAMRFIIDDRTGELFTSGEYEQHKPTTAKYICKMLDITSEAAKKEFYEVMDIISKKKVFSET